MLKGLILITFSILIFVTATSSSLCFELEFIEEEGLHYLAMIDDDGQPQKLSRTDFLAYYRLYEDFQQVAFLLFESTNILSCFRSNSEPFITREEFELCIHINNQTIGPGLEPVLQYRNCGGNASLLLKSDTNLLPAIGTREQPVRSVLGRNQVTLTTPELFCHSEGVEYPCNQTESDGCGPAYDPALLDQSYEELLTNEKYGEILAKHIRDAGLAERDCFLLRLAEKLPSEEVEYIFENLLTDSDYTPPRLLIVEPRLSPAHIPNRATPIPPPEFDETTGQFRNLTMTIPHCTQDRVALSRRTRFNNLHEVPLGNSCRNDLYRMLNDRSTSFQNAWNGILNSQKNDLDKTREELVRVSQEIEIIESEIFNQSNIEKFILCSKLRSIVGEENWGVELNHPNLRRVAREIQSCGGYPREYELKIRNFQTKAPLQFSLFNSFQSQKHLYFLS